MPEETKGPNPSPGENDVTFAAADAEAADPSAEPQDQKCTHSVDVSDEASQHALFKLPVHPMIAAAMSNPDTH